MPLQLLETAFCREEEIRTLDTVTHILPFQGSSFNHSDTSLCGYEGAKIAFLFLEAKVIFTIRKFYYYKTAYGLPR